MKDYKILLISFILLIFMIGAVSAVDIDFNDTSSASVDESTVGIDLPIGPINPDPFIPGFDPDDEDPTDVEVDVKEIYVKDTGNDSNNGSSESPYATVNRAVSDVNSSNDATIHIGEGTYLLDESLNIDLNHKTFGGNLKFIGAGADKTFISGQNTYYFATIGSNANVTLKDLTIINCKNTKMGGAIVCNGELTANNCVFDNSYANGNNGGVIYAKGMVESYFDFVTGEEYEIRTEPNITITNSKFISSYVNSRKGTTYGGGAIYAQMSNLYLENNSFIDAKLSTKGGVGVAIYTASSKVYIINNKFINLTTGTYDASLYIKPGEITVITENEFINCSNPSTTYSIVNLNIGDVVFEKNTFINSSNSVGNIYAYKINSLNFTIDDPLFNVGTYEINNGVVIPVKMTDDMGNIVKMVYDFKFQVIGENYSFNSTVAQNAKVYTIQFGRVPENGLYNVSILYNRDATWEKYSTTDVLTTLNVSVSNEPVELYVSPEGNDANSGTIDSPFKTIQHAIDVGFENTFTVTIHLLKGIYSGEGNVELTIANKGDLKFIGEKYGETIIDGNNTSWFASITSSCEIENLTFINGKSTNNDLIRGGTLRNCIISNNSVSSDSKYTIRQCKLDNVVYSDNYGRIYATKDISNSYFENNEFISTQNGGIIYAYDAGITIENCTFINNSARYAGVIYATKGFTSKNNHYENNKAIDHQSNQNVYGSGGAIFTNYEGRYTFVNDTYISNYAYTSGVVGCVIWGCNAEVFPVYTFTDCNFINNSAVEGGVTKIKFGNFTNCKFINNTANYGGAISLLPFVKDSYTLEFNNVIFYNNTAFDSGNDIYFVPEVPYGYYGDEDYIYAIDLTINFNDLNVSTYADDVSANVIAPYGAQVSGSTIYFLINDDKIGSAELINNVAILNYAGFDEGKYTLSGYMSYQPESTIINNGTITVKLEGILDKVTYYISNNGSDEKGNGSQNNPFKSISNAIVQASKISREITINIAEGTYTGDLNTQLLLSSMNNITIVGAGIGKTVIDGENINNFATITDGKNKVVVSNLTIQNMLPENVEHYISQKWLQYDGVNPITVYENATLYLDNVNINNCHSGKAIIENNGKLVINNSIMNNNGLSENLISGGITIIENTLLDENFVINSLIKGLAYIKNSEIKNAFNLNSYSIIDGDKLIIENTKIFNDGDNSSLKELGYNNESDMLNPALSFYSRDVWANNISMICNYNSDSINEYWFSGSQYKVLAPFTNLVGPRNVTVYNSTFNNFNCIWGTYLGEQVVSLDGCLFENVSFISHIDLTYDSEFNITNSVFINVDQIIDKKSRYYEGMESEFNCSFESNYWGNNDKPVITFINIPDTLPTHEPNTWIILTEEDGQPVFKLTDGENTTAYEGSLPAEISYVADENGDVIPVLNLVGTGYKLSVDENGSIVLNTTEPMKNIVPKVAVNETVFANDTIAVINDGSKFNAVFTNKWGDPLKDTNVSFIVGEKTINATTDANGTATFDIDFALGQYIVSVINPVTGQSIEKTISVITEETTFASDVNATYNDGSKFSAKFTDEFGVPLANTNVTFIVGEKTINATTDVNGTASFDIDLKPGIFNVDITNPVTSQKLSKTITVTTAETISASDVTVTYGDAAKFAATFTDQYGVALAYTNVTFIVGEKTINATTDVNGTASFDVNFDAGKYNVTIANPVTGQAVTKAIVVSKLATKLTATKVNMVYNTGKSLKATLKDANGKALEKQTVYIKINGKTYKRTTNAKGQVSLKITLPVKKSYTATVTYNGNANYANSSASAKVVVKKASPKMAAKAKTFKTKTKKYVITLKDNKGKAMKKAKVTLTTKVKGKKVKLTVKTKNNGKATFNLKKLVKGKYTVAVKFAGNKNFKAMTKKVKITVKK